MKNQKEKIKLLKAKLKERMSEHQWIECNAIIHSASLSNGLIGFGLAKLAVADNVAMSAVQIPMVISLGKVFDKQFSKTAALSITGSKIGSYIGISISKVLWGKIPIVGNVINAGTSISITELLGWLIVESFVD